MTIDLTTYTNEQLTELINEIDAERNRRAQQPIIKKEISSRIDTIVTAIIQESPQIMSEAPESTRENPREWKPWQPNKPETHFKPESYTKHNGKLWISRVKDKLNVWEPGVETGGEPAWEEVVAENEESNDSSVENEEVADPAMESESEEEEPSAPEAEESADTGEK